jgi:hypothetical protein
MTELSMADAIFLPDESRLIISSIDMPDTKAIYPGISGTTQGDRNDRSPAANTMSNDKSCSIFSNLQ